jgi:hypothetical protein
MGGGEEEVGGMLATTSPVSLCTKLFNAIIYHVRISPQPREVRNQPQYTSSRGTSAQAERCEDFMTNGRFQTGMGEEGSLGWA